VIDAAVAEAVLCAALRRGGDFAELFAEDRRSTQASLDDGRVEELTSSRDRGAGVRVVVGETTGYAYTADLSEAGLLRAAEVAAAVARAGSGRTVVLAADDAPPRPGPRLAPEAVDKAAKVELLRRADEAARAAGGAIAQVTATYADSRRRILVANSDGRLVDDDQVRTRLGVTCVAVGDAGLQTGYETVAATSGFELYGPTTAEDVAKAAALRALAKLEARPAPSGVVPVVLAPGTGGILFHEACGHGLEADHVRKGASAFAGRLGEVVASPLVTLVDDGSVCGEWGSFAVDDEGNPATETVLIRDGVLVDYLWDRLRARWGGRSSSANGRRQSYQHLPMVRMTNTFLRPGTDDPEAILEGTEFGVYVRKLGGGQVNTATGDFVFGTVEAYLIEHGRLTAPLRDANLIGNGPEVLRRIDAVGSDFGMTPGTCGKDGQAVPVGCGQPTLRVSAITVGGTAGGG
jgi:TldD protein